MKILTHTSNEYHEYQTPGFNAFMVERTKKLLALLEQGEDVFQIDSDVALFKPHEDFINGLGEHDIIAQQEHNGDICTGFMVVKANQRTIRFFKSVLEGMDGVTLHDQQVANTLLRENFPVDVARFPTLVVTSFGIISGGQVWDGVVEFLMPKCYAFHANYTVGLERKKVLLDLARKANA